MNIPLTTRLASAAAASRLTPRVVLARLSVHPDDRVRAAVARNWRTPVLVVDGLAEAGYSPGDGRTPLRHRFLASLLGAPDRYAFDQTARRRPVPRLLLEAVAHHPDPSVRNAVASNPRTPAHCLAALARDELNSISVARNPSAPGAALAAIVTQGYGDCGAYYEAIENPNMPADILAALAAGDDEEAAYRVAKHPNTPPEVLAAIPASDDEILASLAALNPAAPARARRGFSMIELAVVLVVVGVIATISVPTFQSTIRRASERAELTQVTHAMRNAVALAAINERLDPTGDDLDLAFSELDPDAVVLAASAEPEPDAWRYSADGSGVTVVGASTARSGECVAGTASNRSVSARHLTATGGDPAASLCVAVLDADGEMEFGVDGPPVPVVPGPGGSELSGLVAPDGTDCSLVMPALLNDGTWAAETGWAAGSISGCVPAPFVAAHGGAFGQFQQCPTFATGVGGWVAGRTGGEVPYAFGMPFPDHITDTDAAGGIGCVPTGGPVGEPAQMCPGNPNQTITYSQWANGETCQPSGGFAQVIGGPTAGGQTTVIIPLAAASCPPSLPYRYTLEDGVNLTHGLSGATWTVWGAGMVPPIPGDRAVTLNAPGDVTGFAPGSWTASARLHCSDDDGSMDGSIPMMVTVPFTVPAA